jgi:hypothetical protein
VKSIWLLRDIISPKLFVLMVLVLHSNTYSTMIMGVCLGKKRRCCAHVLFVFSLVKYLFVLNFGLQLQTWRFQANWLPHFLLISNYQALLVVCFRKKCCIRHYHWI